MQSLPVLRAVVCTDRVGPSTEPECPLTGMELCRAATPRRASTGADAAPYEVINLGNNNQTVSLLEMIQGLEQARGVKAKLDWKPERPGDVPQT